MYVRNGVVEIKGTENCMRVMNSPVENELEEEKCENVDAGEQKSCCGFGVRVFFFFL